MQTSTLYWGGGGGGHLMKLLFCLLINFHDCRCNMVKIPFVTELLETFTVEWRTLVTHHRNKNTMLSKPRLQYGDDT